MELFINKIICFQYPPSMTEDQRKKLENEAKSWLQIQINEIALKKSCAIKPNEEY
jgi:hypothetical protein